MTTDVAIDRRRAGSSGSVRQRLSGLAREHRALLALLGLTVAVHGWRAMAPLHAGGDLLYHWGLTHTMLLGTVPAEGPYLGLPAYYPPGFHLLLAGLASLPGLDVVRATVLLSVIWIPVIPLGAYLLGRRLSGRADVGLVAAALTAFAGGLDVSSDRLWVNSLSMSGQVAYPVYPRDLVFGLLPFAVIAFLNALRPGPRWSTWAIIAGLLLGICGLIQVQLLLPMPTALAVAAVVVTWRSDIPWRIAIGALTATGLTAALVVAPWLIAISAAIARNGGVSIDSSEGLVPIAIGFWSYPIQFGLILPAAVVGVGVVLLLARRSLADSVWSRRWRPAAPGAAIMLLPWWLVPFVLAVLYRPTWPLEDALRPQRLWMVASQPGLILAAMGLVALADEVAAGRWSAIPRPVRRPVPLLLAATLLASGPATAATTGLMARLWVEPQYAHLWLVPDRVPDMRTLLPDSGPRSTVLTYEDWSSLAWYHTGLAVVAVEPPGYAKLAFDPGEFTGFGQADRRLDLGRALSGDPAAAVRMADRYGADRIVLARRDDAVGLVGWAATVAAALGQVDGPSERIASNGYDQLALDPGSALTLPIAPAMAGPIRLEIRVGTDAPVGADGRRPPARFQVRVGDGPPIDLSATPRSDGGGSVVAIAIERPAGAPIRIQAVDRVLVQGVLGFAGDPGPPTGWAVATTTPDAVVWERRP